jgi:predicted dehydrogenase
MQWRRDIHRVSELVVVRAVVIGTGFAGEGYVKALRTSGVDVVALCGRSAETAEAMGDRLDVAEVRLDWRAAIDDLTPDVVVIATPAAPHVEMAEYAAGRGAHLLCEKPLGRNADEARRMLEAVEAAGVKHAYGGTSRYDLVLGHARDLIADGAIGDLLEIELVYHWGLPPLMPYCWVHRLELGGGVLFNAYTHVLAQAQYVSGGVARWATGRTDVVIDRVPVGPPLHDFRQWAPLDPDQVAAGEWQHNDADLSATVITGLDLPEGRGIAALFHSSALTSARHPGYLALYGTTGTLHLDGPPWYTELHLLQAGNGGWRDITITPDEDPIQSGWDHLVADLIDDVNGSDRRLYPTFHDGFLANLLIDQVRDGNPSDAIAVTTGAEGH